MHTPLGHEYLARVNAMRVDNIMQCPKHLMYPVSARNNSKWDTIVAWPPTSLAQPSMCWLRFIDDTFQWPLTILNPNFVKLKNSCMKTQVGLISSCHCDVGDKVGVLSFTASWMIKSWDPWELSAESSHFCCHIIVLQHTCWVKDVLRHTWVKDLESWRQSKELSTTPYQLVWLQSLSWASQSTSLPGAWELACCLRFPFWSLSQQGFVGVVRHQ